MNLQLADGSLETPMGLLENVLVKSCGIEFEHTFAVVDFGQETNYEVILGRPFMRQFLMIQDWGYNYLYLRHEGVITRVNLKTHSYRDVTHSPVDEFDSGSSNESGRTLSEGRADLWVCGASRRSICLDGSDWDRSVMDELRTFQYRFQSIKLDPQEWHDILATLDVSALPSLPNSVIEMAMTLYPYEC